MVWFVIWYGMVSYDMVWYASESMVWYSMIYGQRREYIWVFVLHTTCKENYKVYLHCAFILVQDKFISIWMHSMLLNPQHIFHLVIQVYFQSPFETLTYQMHHKSLIPTEHFQESKIPEVKRLLSVFSLIFVKHLPL